MRFEQEPNNTQILSNIFRLVHTIKGTCGFLALSRLERLTHAAESLMGKFRDGMPVTSDAVTLILATLDRVKSILRGIESLEHEPEGDDTDLIGRLAPCPAVTPHAVSRRGANRRRQRSRSRSARSMRRPMPIEAASGEPALPEAADKRVEATEKSAPDAGDKLANHSIRVSVDTLDHLMTTVSELVLTRNQLLEIVRRHEDSDFKVPLQRLSNVTAELQEGVMKTRMQPIGNAWQKLPRVVRDLVRRAWQMHRARDEGAETELDRQVLELVKDPLTHLVRNCADHGIESPAERTAAGKPQNGTIRLTACHQGGHIIIEIADDGRGLDIARIKAKALDLEGSPAKPTWRRNQTPKSAISSSRPAFPPRPKSPAFPAAASAWTSFAAISSRSAARWI